MSAVTFVKCPHDVGDFAMTDRRPINKNVNVPKPGGGEQPRSRNQDGQIRDKRSDAGKSRSK